MVLVVGNFDMAKLKQTQVDLEFLKRYCEFFEMVAIM